MRFFKTKTTSEKIYFVVMGNLFKTSLELSLRYDLKGSIKGRTSRNEFWYNLFSYIIYF